MRSKQKRYIECELEFFKCVISALSFSCFDEFWFDIKEFVMVFFFETTANNRIHRQNPNDLKYCLLTELNKWKTSIDLKTFTLFTSATLIFEHQSKWEFVTEWIEVFIWLSICDLINGFLSTATIAWIENKATKIECERRKCSFFFQHYNALSDTHSMTLTTTIAWCKQVEWMKSVPELAFMFSLPSKMSV